MNDTEKNRNYHIFKCHFPGCHEIIPIETFSSSTIPSMGISYLQNEGVELSHDLFAVDVPCPYCSQTNHLQMKDMVKPINRKEYEELSRAVESKMSLIQGINKVLQS
ncbi:MAG: hypothetical protein ABSA71_02855 [Desulfomonilia bacterium]|jgi:hypothetical protein